MFRHFPDTGEGDDVDKAQELLTAYFEPQKNRLYDVHKFQEAKQGNNRSISHKIAFANRKLSFPMLILKL